MYGGYNIFAVDEHSTLIFRFRYLLFILMSSNIELTLSIIMKELNKPAYKYNLNKLVVLGAVCLMERLLCLLFSTVIGPKILVSTLCTQATQWE